MSRERFVKPRVFLSHSKKDSAFIERLERALRLCQIDPWLDTFEIRHGKPWLDAIFEDGIPTCDSVLVYFTPHSLGSPVVKKELDAGVVSQLADSSVALLPYVENAELRNEVRADIQALQVPEWNEGNFDAVLAQCVAEIWRSFHERRIGQAVAEEKVRRLEAERALGEGESATFCGLSYSDLAHLLMERGLMLALTSVRDFLRANLRGTVAEAADVSKRTHGGSSEEWRGYFAELENMGPLRLSHDPPKRSGTFSQVQTSHIELSTDGKRFLNRFDLEVDKGER